MKKKVIKLVVIVFMLGEKANFFKSSWLQFLFFG